MICPLYSELRDALFLYVENMYNNFGQMSENDKFNFLFSNGYICSIVAKTCHQMLMCRNSHLYQWFYIYMYFLSSYKHYLVTTTSINDLIGHRIYNYLVCFSTNWHLNTSGYTISLSQSRVTHVSFKSYINIGHWPVYYIQVFLYFT